MRQFEQISTLSKCLSLFMLTLALGLTSTLTNRAHAQASFEEPADPVDMNSTEGLGKLTLRTLDEVATLVSPQDFQTQLAPVQKSARQLKVTSQGGFFQRRSEYALPIRDRAMALVDAITKAEPFLLNQVAISQIGAEKVKTLFIVRERLLAMYESH